MTEFDRTKYATSGEVARKTGMSVETVRRWCREGRIPSIVTSTGRVFIPVERIDDYLPRPGDQPRPDKQS